MPIMYGKDSSKKNKKKCWVKWGKSGKKYYYICDNARSRNTALGKAKAQRKAIYSSGYKGD